MGESMSNILTHPFPFENIPLCIKEEYFSLVIFNLCCYESIISFVFFD